MKKILFLSACPSKGWSDIRFGDEIKKIRKSLQIPQFKKEALLSEEFGVDLDSFCSSVTKNTPDFLHFSMHGDPSEGIVFQTLDGKNADYISEEMLEDWLSNFKLQCVVLACCYSQRHAEVIAERIPYVIACSGELKDDDAINFSSLFYEGLFAKPDDIEFSYNVGKSYAKMKKNGYGLDDDLSLFLIKNQNKVMDNLPKLKENTITPTAIEELIEGYKKENSAMPQTLFGEINSKFQDIVDLIDDKKAEIVYRVAKECKDLNSSVTLDEFEEDLTSYLELIHLCLETERFNSLEDPLLGTETEEAELEMLIKGMECLGNLMYHFKEKGISYESIAFFNQAISHLVARLRQ